METLFLIVIIFLFLLAIFDLYVGVSNDAVNFLNSAVGSKAAKFKTILIVASIGVFVGAAMSNGMMEIARHGIFQPEYYYADELIFLFVAVMVTDVILLDAFNSFGMPTSTTVSMVFELLGGSVALALFKLHNNPELSMGMLLNTDKALSVIIGIFVSVAIAFFFGTLVQYISRLIFTFNYKKNLGIKIGIFGGIAITAIIYFMLIKGLKDASYMTPDTKQWIHDNTLAIVGGCFVFFTIVMQILHWCKVNVFKVIVLTGTFSLALAFAGNDLVNFIGVPLAGFSTYTDYMNMGNGVGFDNFLMGSLNGPAKTPVIFLIAAGAIMVFALVTSKKAHRVIQTELNLGKQDEGSEMFGSSPIARKIVRKTSYAADVIVKIIPDKALRWADSRFNKDDIILEDNASFDLVRASVNLVLAGLLIALGTSLKLPLSTTYVTFMVAMGTSLADRAWTRESAVYRVTGVLSVIGGWLFTAFAAFLLCFIVTALIHVGGMIVIAILCIGLIIFLIINRGKVIDKTKNDDDLIVKIEQSSSDSVAMKLLCQHYLKVMSKLMRSQSSIYISVTDGFINQDLKVLRKTLNELKDDKFLLKNSRRKEIIAMRKMNQTLVMQKSTWMHQGFSSCEQMLYSFRRICDPCKEHVDNNFSPLPAEYVNEFIPIRNDIYNLITRVEAMVTSGDFTMKDSVSEEIDQMRKNVEMIRLAEMTKVSSETYNPDLLMLYQIILQESEELLTQLKHLLRGVAGFVQ